MPNNLRKYRTLAKMTKKELAARSGIPTSTIARYEKGTSNIVWEHALIFSNIFGCTPIDLLCTEFSTTEDREYFKKEFMVMFKRTFVTFPNAFKSLVDIYEPDYKAKQLQGDRKTYILHGICQYLIDFVPEMKGLDEKDTDRIGVFEGLASNIITYIHEHINWDNYVKTTCAGLRKDKWTEFMRTNETDKLREEQKDLAQPV